MSVQFGRWNFDGQPPSVEYIAKVNTTLAPYGPDSNESYSKGGVRILYRAFHTTSESHREIQPHIVPSGVAITWDGRLDNRAELIHELRSEWIPSVAMTCSVSGHRSGTNSILNSTDVQIVAAAYEKWGAGCLAKLIGDWALSIWNPHDHSVLLAKDLIGTRHLYYSFEKDHATWSTILDPLVLFAGKTFSVCEEYIASWLSPFPFPAPNLTPYVGVHAVPPSSSVRLTPGKRQEVTKYWDFDPGSRISYKTDGEYEEHFRCSFATAVQRRLRADRPIVAELSGGMDSSSIVSIADLVIARAQDRPNRPHLNIASARVTPRLDTISWYYECDPNMDERPYFTRVEDKRGRVGYHIDAGFLEHSPPRRFIPSDFTDESFAVTPIPNGYHSEFYKAYAAHLTLQGHRVVLSGVGGDDAMGRTLTPRPEFQNLVARARFLTLARRLDTWAVKMRVSRLKLLWKATRGFFPLALTRLLETRRPVPWFYPEFRHRNYTTLCGCPRRVRFIGPLPVFQENVHTLNLARKVLAYYALFPDMLHERRYPYLDQDLLKFMFAIPREQIVRAGERRSLMRRALAGIVPEQVLNRTRVAASNENPKNNMPTEWPSLVELGRDMVGNSLGIIDRSRLVEAFAKVGYDVECPIDSLERTLILEFWLRHLRTHGVLARSVSTKRPNSIGSRALHKSPQSKSLAS
jgi:asparagine synthase (glutamine-hydrolysing)